MDELGTTVAVLCERVDTLQKVVIDEKKRLNGNLERIDQRLVALDKKLQAGLEKPSWGVAMLITSLASGLSALVVRALTR